MSVFRVSQTDTVIGVQTAAVDPTDARWLVRRCSLSDRQLLHPFNAC